MEVSGLREASPAPHAESSPQGLRTEGPPGAVLGTLAAWLQPRTSGRTESGLPGLTVAQEKRNGQC